MGQGLDEIPGSLLKADNVGDESEEIVELGSETSGGIKMGGVDVGVALGEREGRGQDVPGEEAKHDWMMCERGQCARCRDEHRV